MRAIVVSACICTEILGMVQTKQIKSEQSVVGTMLSKSTRAFRTISEAGDELDLQPHVLRFWESKFAEIQPMKRSAGRRFYRPEDIELLRGIKILLHDEKHPIKDVQKLIRMRGVQSVVDLGRAKVKAANPRDIKDTDLVPKRIKPVSQKKALKAAKIVPITPIPIQQAPIQVADPEIVRRPSQPSTPIAPVTAPVQVQQSAQATAQETNVDQARALSAEKRHSLEQALKRLRSLKSQWEEFI